MQEFVCLAVKGFTEEIAVKALNHRIFMALAQFFADIFAVNGPLPRFDDLNIPMMIGLSRAADATTRTRHYLNDMIFQFTSTQFVHNDACVG